VSLFTQLSSSATCGAIVNTGRDSVAVLSLAAMSSTESRWPAAALMISSYAWSLLS
jgi:hypothetical protein